MARIEINIKCEQLLNKLVYNEGASEFMRMTDTSNLHETKAGYQSNRIKYILKVAKNLLLLTAVMTLCTLISMLMKRFVAHESISVMVYFLGIQLFSYLTGSYIYSFLASLFGVLSFNFFFTVPYFSLHAYGPDYALTFIIMFLVGSFTSMLTIRLKRETSLAAERERNIQDLYQIGRKLLGVKSGSNLAEISAELIAVHFHADVLIQFLNSEGNVLTKTVNGEDVFSTDLERIVCHEASLSAVPCGCGTKLFSHAMAYYTPIFSKSGVIGVVGVYLLNGNKLTKAQIQLLDSIITQVSVVLEREVLYQEQERTQIEYNRERLRSDILRTISHDLRTPLTGIMGSASTVRDNYTSISDELKKSFLQDIYDDACWLNELVENALNMTRFDEGKVKLNIGEEAAEELIAQAISHVKNRAQGHSIVTEIPSDLILLKADGVLITQVLINLLDNAINYTPEGSRITVSLESSDDYVQFNVSDNGPGISNEDQSHLFERLYNSANKQKGRHGFGLGLSLCKSIVEAHGGAIEINDLEPQGTSVTFKIPLREDLNNAAADFSC